MKSIQILKRSPKKGSKTCLWPGDAVNFNEPDFAFHYKNNTNKIVYVVVR